MMIGILRQLRDATAGSTPCGNSPKTADGHRRAAGRADHPGRGLRRAPRNGLRALLFLEERLRQRERELAAALARVAELEQVLPSVDAVERVGRDR